MFLLLLFACADHGTVTVTCTHDYVTAGAHDTGSYPGFEATCDDWAEHGEVQMGSLESGCLADGIDAGADTGSCTCTPDYGTCTFPNGVND